MPIPIIIGIGAAAVAGVSGIVAGIKGLKRFKDANNLKDAANIIHEQNVANLKSANDKATQAMDELGKLELEILHSFELFSVLFEQIHNKPEFAHICIGEQIPQFNPAELKQVYIAANVALGSLAGAVAGTASGFAASGAATALMMMLGTASTGTAISTLSGAAATNAVLAAFGGGAVAAGGGGIALGSTVLGSTTFGIGLLVGGIVLNISAHKLSQKAEEAMDQAEREADKTKQICHYLSELTLLAQQYSKALATVQDVYEDNLLKMGDIVHRNKDWNTYSKDEQLTIENTQTFVAVLYKMCKTNLIIHATAEDSMNRLNSDEVKQCMNDAQLVVSKLNNVSA